MLAHSEQEREVDACEDDEGDELEGEPGEEDVRPIVVRFDVIGRDRKGTAYSLNEERANIRTDKDDGNPPCRNQKVF